MRAILWLVLLLALPAPALAGPEEIVLAAASQRPGMSLAGAWHYSLDPYRAGMAGIHGEPPYENQRRYADIDVAREMARDPQRFYEFDMDRAPVALLPSSWLTHTPEMRHYQGLVWYQRHFDAAPGAGKRLFLRFEAANRSAIVYLNGRLVGRHEGGFTPFTFDVTEIVRPGDNQITVGVDSTPSPHAIPAATTDWENYGGITRDVRLIETPATWIDDSWVRMTRDGRIAVDMRLRGPEAANRPVSLRIAALDLTLRGRTDGTGRWHGQVDAPPGLRRWSPEAPQLYDVEIRAGEDLWQDRIGFRTLRIEGTHILLNDRPVFLRGICLHEEEFGPSPSRTITPQTARALLLAARDGLHANYVRLAHYPHSEVMTRLADELGLIVWSEIPVYWQVAFDDPDALQSARTMQREAILRDRNRAAIAIWSIANETPVTPARNLFLRTLAADARALDDSRLISAALLATRSDEGGHPVLTMADPMRDLLDIVSVNSYIGWYEGDPLNVVPRIEWRGLPDKPVILSEFGAGALAGFHDPAHGKFSEEFQADYYRATLAMAQAMPSLAGMSPWVLKDFRSPRRQHPIYQQGWNRKGLLSETGARKAAFDVLADWYRARAAQASSMP